MKSIPYLSLLLVFFSYSAFAQEVLLQSSGKLTFLRVHEVGSGYGPNSDFIDVEVVIKLSDNSPRAYGFTLRDDNNKYTHQGMLDLLRDAFNYNHQVTINFSIDPTKNNGRITRVWLTKPSESGIDIPPTKN